MENQTRIICPNCATSIDVNNVLTQQLEVEYKKKLNAQILEERKKNEEFAQKLILEKEEFEQKRKKENELFQERVQIRLKEEKQRLEIEISEKIAKENSEQYNLIQKELYEKTEQLKELYKTKAEIEKLKREKDEVKSIVEAEAEKRLSEEKEKIRKIEEEKQELKIKELQKKLEDQQRLTEEMKRKQEQGSMQMQGEIQELAMEEWLKSNFPFDEISEVKKGARGADCLHKINAKISESYGTIYYESKRTKEFQHSWVEKFKTDLREVGATIGVLVTDAMPKNMQRMGLYEGFWVCNYQEFKGLCFALRESIVMVHNANVSQENKGDKMAMLYDYLTGNEFRLQIEAIVEGFTQMQADLDAEKRAMQGIWKKREKQIEKVLLNTNFMYNSVKGIAGNAIKPIKSLELPETEEDFSELDESI